MTTSSAGGGAWEAKLKHSREGGGGACKYCSFKKMFVLLLNPKET